MTKAPTVIYRRRVCKHRLGFSAGKHSHYIDSQTQNISTDITFDMIAKELEAEYNATNARGHRA